MIVGSAVAEKGTRLIVSKTSLLVSKMVSPSAALTIFNTSLVPVLPTISVDAVNPPLLVCTVRSTFALLLMLSVTSLPNLIVVACVYPSLRLTV